MANRRPTPMSKTCARTEPQVNGVALCRKVVAMDVVALSGSGILVATSAAPGAAATGGCAGTAYVLNQVDGTVSVINTATGALSPPIAVGILPSTVAITPDGKRAYVTNFGNGTVQVITTATGAVSAPVKVGTGPPHVAICPARIAHRLRS